MGAPEKIVEDRYKVEVRVTKITRTDIRDTYDKKLQGRDETETEIELLQSQGGELVTLLERVKKSIDLVIEDL